MDVGHAWTFLTVAVRYDRPNVNLEVVPNIISIGIFYRPPPNGSIRVRVRSLLDS